MKLIAFLVLLLTFSGLDQTCTEGCLKCDASSNCIVPDISKGYYLSNNAAVKTSLTFCLVLAFDGTCAQCNADYYVDATTGKCTAVPTANKVGSCQYYSSATACRSCLPGFYLDTTCKAVATTITGCAIYASATTCQTCNAGTLLNLAGTLCVSASSLSNCSGYSNVACKACDANFFLNNNNYLAASLALDATTADGKQKLAALAQSVVLGTANTGNAVCVTSASTNCKTFAADSATCTVCAANYFLDAAGKCVAYPVAPIVGCGVYTDNATCASCLPNYTKNGNVCTAIVGDARLDNCATYDTTANTVVCQTCDANYYLGDANNTDTSCKIRVNSLTVDNCLAKAINADECAVCNEDFVRNSARTKCYAELAGCAETAVATISGTETTTCTTCASGFYAVTASGRTTCTQGTITGCGVYGNNGTTCTSCALGYYSGDTGCVAQTPITNCATFGTAQGVCAVCALGSNFSFTYGNTCQAIPAANLKTGCATYSGTLAAPVCETCKPGYYKNGANCDANGKANCYIQDTANSCTDCKAGFVLKPDYSDCVAPLSITTANCDDHPSEVANFESFGNATCNICNENYVPLDLQNLAACFTSAEATLLNGGTLPAVTDCLKYNADFQCVQCNFSGANIYLLTADETTAHGTCGAVATCTKGYRKFRLTSTTDSPSIAAYNVCYAGTAITGCQVVGYDLSNGLADICNKCSSTYINVAAAANATYSNADPDATGSTFAAVKASYVPAVNARFRGVTCTLKTAIQASGGTAFTSSNNSEPVANCAYYRSAAANDYVCDKCIANYTSPISSGATGYLTACSADAACDSTSTYYSADAFVASYFSCKKCADATKIPILGYTSTGANNPTFSSFASYRYSLFVKTDLGGNEYRDWLTTTTPSNNITCQVPATTPANWVNTNTWYLNANCAVAAVAVQLDGVTVNDNTTKKYGHFCAGCKPGFKPAASGTAVLIDATYPFVKPSCVAITGCTLAPGNTMNACTSCDANYVLDFVSDNIDFTNCRSTANATGFMTNCLAATFTNNIATACEVCKPGFHLNEDNFCEELATNNCPAASFNIAGASSTATLSWSLFVNGAPNGCSACSGTGNLIVAWDEELTTCVASTYTSGTILDNANLETSAYVAHCKNYSTDATTNHVCAVCDSGYIVDGAVPGFPGARPIPVGRNCISNANISNCVIAEDANTCLECKDTTFAIKSSKCVAGTIANCAVFANFEGGQGATEICLTCQPEYIVNDTYTACVQGEVPNCAELSTATQCNTCNDGYYKITGEVDVCYPLPDSLLCDEFNQTDINTAKLTCETCTSPDLQLSVPYAAAKTVCLPFATIEHCIDYGVSPDIANNDFRCRECDSGFYLSNYRCAARVNKPAKCSVYTVDADTCDECDSTSFLSNGGIECTSYPSGITNCSTYSNATTCTACANGYYLANNACTLATVIANCLTYSNATTCSACVSGRFLVNNTCTTVATATGCATYSSAIACATCATAGQVLIAGANGAVNCGAGTVTGCATYSTTSPYGCLTCGTGYYPTTTNGTITCTASASIANCDTYATATTCSKCKTNYVLNVEKTACTIETTASLVPYADVNCADSQQSATPVCNRCSAGRYFVNGACTGTCSVSGCLACNPSSNATCYICNTGYYQDSTGKCNATEADNTGSASMFGVLSAVLMIITVMIK